MQYYFRLLLCAGDVSARHQIKIDTFWLSCSRQLWLGLWLSVDKRKWNFVRGKCSGTTGCKTETLAHAEGAITDVLVPLKWIPERNKEEEAKDTRTEFWTLDAASKKKKDQVTRSPGSFFHGTTSPPVVNKEYELFSLYDRKKGLKTIKMQHCWMFFWWQVHKSTSDLLENICSEYVKCITDVAITGFFCRTGTI